MNTIITEKTPAGEIQYDVFSKLVSDRILFLYDYIDDRVATDTVATLLYLDSLDSESQINIYINSEGGNVRSVFMIYDIMLLVKSPIQTICLGAATGAPALLLAAGAPGFRSATKSSFLCINQLQADSAMYVDMTDAKIAFSQLRRDNKKFIENVAKVTGKKVAQVTKDSERKLFMNPTQAKRYGLIDNVLDWKR